MSTMENTEFTKLRIRADFPYTSYKEMFHNLIDVLEKQHMQIQHLQNSIAVGVRIETRHSEELDNLRREILELREGK